jgi:hypothetical protein
MPGEFSKAAIKVIVSLINFSSLRFISTCCKTVDIHNHRRSSLVPGKSRHDLDQEQRCPHGFTGAASSYTHDSLLAAGPDGVGVESSLSVINAAEEQRGRFHSGELARLDS